jgi:hypothetical protein
VGRNYFNNNNKRKEKQVALFCSATEQYQYKTDFYHTIDVAEYGNAGASLVTGERIF